MTFMNFLIDAVVELGAGAGAAFVIPLVIWLSYIYELIDPLISLYKQWLLIVKIIGKIHPQQIRLRTLGC